MKNILIINYYWPPSGGAAVQRWLSFANRLAEQNYRVHLLTVDASFATYQLEDPGLVARVNSKIQVYTTKTIEPFRLFTLLFGKKSLPKPAFSNESNPSFLKKTARFVRGNMFIPDPRKGWKNYAVKTARAIIAKEEIDCLITAGPPHSTHFIGKELKESFNLFWIADFHDLWTDVIYYDMLYHLPWVKRKDSRLEKTILEACDLILTIGEKYKEKLLSKSKLLTKNKIKVLRIGYDKHLFADETSGIVQNEFRISYTGTMASYYYPQVFINALKNVVARFPEVNFSLRFAGVLSQEIKNDIITAGLGNIFSELGYLQHQESIQILNSSTILLLVNPVTKDEEMVIPGKLYEYLASMKPIINISSRGAETAQIIADCVAGRTFERSEIATLEQHLSELVLQWKENKTLDLRNHQQLIRKYSREQIGDDLVKIIELKK